MTQRKHVTMVAINIVCYILMAKYLSLADITILVVLLNVCVGYTKLLVWLWFFLSLTLSASY